MTLDINAHFAGLVQPPSPEPSHEEVPATEPEGTVKIGPEGSKTKLTFELSHRETTKLSAALHDMIADGKGRKFDRPQSAKHVLRFVSCEGGVASGIELNSVLSA